MNWVPVAALIVSVMSMVLSVGITVVLWRMTQAIRKYERLEDKRDTEVAELERRLHAANEKIIDEQLGRMTHGLAGRVNGFALTLKNLTDRIQASDEELASLAGRDQQIELAVASKFDVLKDFLRKEMATGVELQRHEDNANKKFDTVQRELGLLGKDVAVLSDRVTKGTA